MSSSSYIQIVARIFFQELIFFFSTQSMTIPDEVISIIK